MYNYTINNLEMLTFCFKKNYFYLYVYVKAFFLNILTIILNNMYLMHPALYIEVKIISYRFYLNCLRSDLTFDLYDC